MKSLQRVLVKDGKLYLGVPVGCQNSVAYNVHRIFYPMTIIENFDQMGLIEFLYVQNCNTVSVHVRRGDYVKHKKIYGLCSNTYYQRAMQVFKENVDEPVYFSFQMI